MTAVKKTAPQKTREDVAGKALLFLVIFLVGFVIGSLLVGLLSIIQLQKLEVARWRQWYYQQQQLEQGADQSADQLLSQ